MNFVNFGDRESVVVQILCPRFCSGGSEGGQAAGGLELVELGLEQGD